MIVLQLPSDEHVAIWMAAAARRGATWEEALEI
jgi:hypothetical protein